MDGWMDGWTDIQRDKWINTHPSIHPSIHPSTRTNTSLSLCIYRPFRIQHRLSVCICLYIHLCMLRNNYLRSLHYHAAQTMARVPCCTYTTTQLRQWPGSLAVLTYCRTVTVSTLQFCSPYCTLLSESMQSRYCAAAAHHTSQQFKLSRTHGNS